MTRDERIDELLATRDIQRLLADYMRGQDRLMPDLHRSLFFDDATTDYGEFVGGADAFVDFAQELLATHAANHHMLGQVSIDFEGDVAFGEVYFQAYHRVTRDGSDEDLWVGGRYLDRYERRGGSWKIAHRRELVDWLRLEPAADAMLRTRPWPWGARAPDDQSCDRELLRRA